MQPIPTVRIVSPVSDENPHGYVVINQSDFDHTQHQAWGDAPDAQSADAPAPKRRAKAAE